MSRVDLYKFIHKAQRAHFFDLASRLGRTSLSDEKELQVIAEGLRGMIAHLKAHSMNELTFIHPLFTEAGKAVHGIDEEHEELEGELEKLEEILDEENWQELYPALNHFIGVYLLHQDEEESLQEEVLWTHFGDERLAEVFVKFQASRSLSQKIEDIEFLLPGLSRDELQNVFRGAQTSFPAEAFQRICETAQKQLEKSRWAELNSSTIRR